MIAACSGEEQELEVVRVYDTPRPGNYRVLVDRLWPRGVSKQQARLDEWMKDVAPSTELRRWYAHEPSRFESFAEQYRAELRRDPAAGAVSRLHELAESGAVSLVTATRDIEHSGAKVLYDHLRASDR